jgi:hypothetical protein
MNRVMQHSRPVVYLQVQRNQCEKRLLSSWLAICYLPFVSPRPIERVFPVSLDEFQQDDLVPLLVL